MFKKGDIVLVPFPFTDLSGEKVRPAVVVAEDREDICMVFISSVKSRENKYTLHLVEKKARLFGLKKESWIKVSKVATLEKKIILGIIGALDKDVLKELQKILKDFFAIT